MTTSDDPNAADGEHESTDDGTQSGIEEPRQPNALALTAAEIEAAERDRHYADAARAVVPNIGAGTHWYDVTYGVLGWVRKPGINRRLPYRARKRISDWVNRLYRYHELDLERAWSREDPEHNLFVPADEHVTVPTLWVVELFPPSAAADLTSLVEKYDPSSMNFDHLDSTTVLSQSRAGSGYSWLRLAEFKDPSSTRIAPDARIESLPNHFWDIELTQIQLGSGLTAVVAQFSFTDDGAASLDREWHALHEPRLRRQGKHRLADSRKWSAFSGTQRVRRQSHDMARQWMNEHCAGFFTQAGEPQPLMDSLIVERCMPTSVSQSIPDEQDCLRALGISPGRASFFSTQIPEFALERTDVGVCPTLQTSRSWALWGNRLAASKARPDLGVYHGASDTPEALGYAVDEEARDMLLALSITELVDTMKGQYTTVRDTARAQHDSFTSSDLQSLRRQLLTLSIDLASLEVDVPTWWNRGGRRVPKFVDRDIGSGEARFDLTETLRSTQTDDLMLLSKADSTMRDILGTVATLGAAKDTRWVGRAALSVAAFGLVVAVISLAVAVITFLITSPGDNSIACHTWKTLCAPTDKTDVERNPTAPPKPH